jgi:hypothetical protein
MEFDINLESERGEVLATVGDPQRKWDSSSV